MGTSVEGGAQTPDTAPHVVVVLGADQDAVAWRQRYARGETLDETPYGYDRAEPAVRLSWTRAATESPRARRRRRAIAGRLGFDIVHVWRNRRLIRSADAVWTHTEREHLAVALLQMLVPRGRRVPVLAQSVWLWDAWPGWGAAHRRLIAKLLRTHTIEVVHSRVNLDVARRSVPGRTVELVPFGSATSATSSGRGDDLATEPFVLAVGNDADRDWRVLAAAAGRMPDARFRIASSSSRARSIDWPANAIVRPAATRAELSELYATASVVVVPLADNRHASGATACIEALGAGRPLVVTKVGGVEDYVRGEARLVDVGDAESLANALVDALAGRIDAPSADAAARRGITQRDYVNRYLRVTEWMLGLQEWDAAVSEFAPVSSPSVD
ncbi:MAG TPA: glycosyltransferase [Microbacterium sp.]|nr:glycosyltransferase [Microbacterium sp.]